MSKQERQAAVESLAETLRGSPNMIVTDFSGLTVEHMTTFRSRLRDVGARYLVVKNTLARRALVAGEIPGLDGSVFTGPTGLVLVGPDPLPAAKVLGDFAKEHQKPGVKVGLLDGQVVEAGYLKRLGEIPSREILLGQFAGALNGILYQMVGALEALREQRQSAAS